VSARGQHPSYDAALASLVLDVDQAQARALTERLALLLQASLLLREAASDVAALFCASRLGGMHGLAFGTLPSEAAHGALLERAYPGA
jgi:putative acyl-CoA dehydrogenase